jgi:hypothetical protein
MIALAIYLLGIFFAMWYAWPIAQESGVKTAGAIVAGILWPVIVVFAIVSGIAEAITAAGSK